MVTGAPSSFCSILIIASVVTKNPIGVSPSSSQTFLSLSKYSFLILFSSTQFSLRAKIVFSVSMPLGRGVSALEIILSQTVRRCSMSASSIDPEKYSSPCPITFIAPASSSKTIAIAFSSLKIKDRKYCGFSFFSKKEREGNFIIYSSTLAYILFNPCPIFSCFIILNLFSLPVKSTCGPPHTSVE